MAFPGASTKLREVTVSVVLFVPPSLRLLGTTRLPLNEFLMNSDVSVSFENLSKKFTFR